VRSCWKRPSSPDTGLTVKEPKSARHREKRITYTQRDGEPEEMRRDCSSVAKRQQ
jgi:hypothetical protein